MMIISNRDGEANIKKDMVNKHTEKGLHYVIIKLSDLICWTAKWQTKMIWVSLKPKELNWMHFLDPTFMNIKSMQFMRLFHTKFPHEFIRTSSECINNLYKVVHFQMSTPVSRSLKGNCV